MKTPASSRLWLQLAVGIFLFAVSPVWAIALVPVGFVLAGLLCVITLWRDSNENEA